MTVMRGVRGATTVDEDDAGQIHEAMHELLEAMLDANPQMRTDDIASAFFSVTDDLRATYPALSARQIGWDHVPMLCFREIPVPGGLPRCIRVLIHWNTDVEQETIRHVYLRDAVRLRPDLVEEK